MLARPVAARVLVASGEGSISIRSCRSTPSGLMRSLHPASSQRLGHLQGSRQSKKIVRLTQQESTPNTG